MSRKPTSLSNALTEHLGRKDIAQLGALIAGKLGANQAEIEKGLDNALVSAGEEGLKQLLEMIIEGVSGSPTARPENPYDPSMPPEIEQPTILMFPPIPLP